MSHKKPVQVLSNVFARVDNVWLPVASNDCVTIGGGAVVMDTEVFGMISGQNLEVT